MADKENSNIDKEELGLNGAMMGIMDFIMLPKINELCIGIRNDGEYLTGHYIRFGPSSVKSDGKIDLEDPQVEHFYEKSKIRK